MYLLLMVSLPGRHTNRSS